MQIYHVNPNDVTLYEPKQYKRDVERQKRRLETEGQIEPIQVKKRGDKLIVDPNDFPYNDAIVVAARELKWETILVTY